MHRRFVRGRGLRQSLLRWPPRPVASRSRRRRPARPQPEIVEPAFTGTLTIHGGATTHFTSGVGTITIHGEFARSKPQHGPEHRD